MWAVEYLVDRYVIIESLGGSSRGKYIVPKQIGDSDRDLDLREKGYVPDLPNVALDDETLNQSMRARAYYGGRVLTDGPIKEAIANFRAVTEQRPQQRDVWIRVAPWETPDGRRAVVIDLGSRDGTAGFLLITAAAIERIPVSPVVFLRTDDVGPLPAPDLDEPASMDELRGFFNMEDNQFFLTLAWMCMCFDARRAVARPILTIEGPSGTGKSSAQGFVQRLVDEDGTDGKQTLVKKTVEELISQATTRWVLAPDNLSTIDEERSNVLCTISTGGTALTRTLNKTAGSSNSKLGIHRPIVLSSVSLRNGKTDFANRCLQVQTSRHFALVSEDQLERRFVERRSALIARVLLTVHEAMQYEREAEERFNELGAERMGALTKWLYMVGKVVGQDLIGPYNDAVKAVQLDAVEGDRFLSWVTLFVEEQRGPVKLSAKDWWELGLRLEGPKNSAGVPSWWPEDAQRVGYVFKEAADALRRSGWSARKVGRSWQVSREPDSSKSPLDA